MSNDLRETTQEEQQAMEYLNDLRTSGECNMFGAGQYLEAEFGMQRGEAREILSLWMANFNEEADYEKVKQ